MNAVSRRPTARSLAAEMSANLPSGGGSGGSNQDVSIEGFVPSTFDLAPGESVTFTLTLENHTGKQRWIQYFITIGGVASVVDQAVLDPGETRELTSTESYDDLTIDRSVGEYDLGVEVQVGQWTSEHHTLNRGTFQILESRSDDDGDENDDDDNNEPPSSLPITNLPTSYLLAGGGIFFALFFLLVLI